MTKNNIKYSDRIIVFIGEIEGIDSETRVL